MPKKSPTRGRIIAGIIILVASVVITASFTDFTSKPNMVPVTQGSTSQVCPLNLDFSKSISKFTISYRNYGERDGAFSATISSGDVLSRYKETGQFEKSSSFRWYAKIENTIPFEFELKKLDEKSLEPINISVDAKCNTPLLDTFSIPCGGERLDCKYDLSQDRVAATYYELVT